MLTGSMAQTTRTPAEGDLEEYRSNECVYYLRTYGNHSALISFYVRHSCWKKAARYIQDNVSNNDKMSNFGAVGDGSNKGILGKNW